VKFLDWKMFLTGVVEKMKTYFLCSVTFFQKLCHLWGNVEKYGGAWQATNIIEPMLSACWETKATDTSSECVILVAFLLQWWLHEMHTACVVKLKTCSFLWIEAQKLELVKVYKNTVYGKPNWAARFLTSAFVTVIHLLHIKDINLSKPFHLAWMSCILEYLMIWSCY
jgi:hypothetical protein